MKLTLKPIWVCWPWVWQFLWLSVGSPGNQESIIAWSNPTIEIIFLHELSTKAPQFLGVYPISRLCWTVHCPVHFLFKWLIMFSMNQTWIVKSINIRLRELNIIYIQVIVHRSSAKTRFISNSFPCTVVGYKTVKSTFFQLWHTVMDIYPHHQLLANKLNPTYMF